MNKEISDQKKNLFFHFISRLEEDPKIRLEDIVILNEVLADFIQSLLPNTRQFSLNVSLVDEFQIQELNRDHRGKDKVTDVLSFPQEENIRAGEFEFMAPENELGDIVICHQVCVKQAGDFSITYTEEFLHLAVHGFLHILGYDHELSPAEEKLMQGLETDILDQVSKKRASN